jgi:hypothetical protein
LSGGFRICITAIVSVTPDSDCSPGACKTGVTAPTTVSRARIRCRDDIIDRRRSFALGRSIPASVTIAAVPAIW